MACSSIIQRGSSSSSSSLTQRRNYDVFISFRGQDTRNNITDHLFGALQGKGIFAFRDDKNLKKGESIAPELLLAIEESQVYVVILSRNYASSTWCLRELEKILEESARVLGKRVLPIFYDVDPSYVRHQKGSFDEAFRKHEKRFKHDLQIVERWRKSLTHVANLSGFDLCDKPQYVEIHMIVEEIIDILGYKFLSLPKNLVGIHTPIEELEKLLQLDFVDDVRILGISGMGGIGKTALAMVLYGRISHQFNACCFIDDLSRVYKHDGPIGAQKQILYQTQSEEHLQVFNVYEGINLIRRKLRRVRALIILDNVDHIDQLEKIGMNREWLGAGSRMIIISRDDHILKDYGVDDVFKVPFLKEIHAYELFCQKAFKLDNIMTINDKLEVEILSYANGLPLAIEVLGSFLNGRSISEWRSALDRLRESPHKDIMDVLRLSFDGLEKNEKDIFLHIACFFKDVVYSYVKNALDCCGLHPNIGLRVLVDKSLITLPKEKWMNYCPINMHRLLQELGRNIARENSVKEPTNWSRLWLPKHLYSAISENMARTYDVCLSFRGEGSDAKFSLHLYTSLRNAGIHVFRHDAEIQEDPISVSVLQAISQSRISVVVLSRNYANSRLSMLELENIMECRRTRGLVVLPVFFEVYPFEVRNQTGKFGEAFDDLMSRTSEDEYRKGVWTAALFEVSSLSGIVVINSRSEFGHVENVVDTVTNLLVNPDLFASNIGDVIQLLNSQNSEDTMIIGICGMGGIGKTAISKAVYNKICCSFEANSFLKNVRGVWKQDDGKVSLQQQLLSDICKTTEIEIDTVESGKRTLQTRLCQKRILLVLDDVNDMDQLNALCGNREWFGQGSRILVSTRNMKILNELQVDHIYEMKLMEDIESLELLCWNAFKQPIPRKGFAKLSTDVVKYCDGLPLALVVVGGFMHGKRETEWKSALEKFKIIPHDIIMENLRISYDDLSDNEKEIFLDISSFFIGMGQDDVIQILEHSRHYAETGIRVLVEQSLVTVDSSERIGMHNLVRAMGKEIIRQKSMGMAEARIYDVFLSFRGADTRAKFISHFYASLQNAGIHVFRDNDGIQRGDQISVSLLQAIRQSRISVVVLSRNYPKSKWCMLELENIIESRRTRGLVVVPVFYEVDPSDVRYQTGKFGEAFKDLMSRILVDEYTKRKWETILFEVGSIAGVVIINSSNESNDMKKVIYQVTHLLNKADLFVAEHPVGVKSRTQEVFELLNDHQSKDRLILGIWGMGGVGKTTIAKAVYNKIRHDFEAKSFLSNVREAWKQDKDKVSLQQRLLSDIYKTIETEITSVESGKTTLKERLSKRKIFLVLDDVNAFDQLEALCGNRKWFGEGSRIIITTRDVSLLHKLQVNHVYEMRVMNTNESLELFSWHAFKQPSPSEGYANLSRDVITYSGGLPLALQVIGSFLFTTGRKTEWLGVLEKLKLIPNHEVLEKLRISFDGLTDDDLKEIFLDIAFFFIGMDQEDVTRVLKDCGHFPEIGLSVLVQRSLITVDRKNKIGMHDLLRDMGKEIVRKKSAEEGKDPSRLWHHKDVHSMLSKDTRTMDVEGLTLKLSRMDQTTSFETKAFQKMNKLRLLQLAGVQLDGDYKYLSRDLRWLCWHGFTSKCAPANFHQGSLVAIDLKYSAMERVWKKSQLLEKLKILNLSHSHNLRQTPDFSMLPNLEKLILKDCPRLSSVSPSIGHLSKILLINFKDCTGLRELPRSIYKLESLMTLILSGCTNIDKLEEDMEQMKSLTTLVADNTSITAVPFAIVRLKRIGYISLCGYDGFACHVFPSIIQSWMSPTNNVLSLVQEFAGTSSLDFLDERNDSFYGLSHAFKDFLNTESLWVNCGSKAQLNQIVGSILGNSVSENCEEQEAMPSTLPNDSPSQVLISSPKTSLTSLLIQMGMNCNATSMLRDDILQILQKRPLSGSTLLPGNKYPDWLTYNGNGSSVTLDVPEVDGRNLKTILCIVNSSSPHLLEGLKGLLLINFTKNTIQFYKRDALLASSSSDEEEWQRLVSNTEPDDKVKVIVALRNGFIVKTTTVYLIYDEPEKNDIIGTIIDKNDNPKANENIHGRVFFQLPSFARAVLISRPFWFCLAGAVFWWSRFQSHKRRSRNPNLRGQIPLGNVHMEVKRQGEKRDPTLP